MIGCKTYWCLTYLYFATSISGWCANVVHQLSSPTLPLFNTVALENFFKGMIWCEWGIWSQSCRNDHMQNLCCYSLAISVLNTVFSRYNKFYKKKNKFYLVYDLSLRSSHFFDSKLWVLKQNLYIFQSPGLKFVRSEKGYVLASRESAKFM